MSVIGQASNDWHLVITRLGRLGHGELREWLCFLNKQALRTTINHLIWTASEYLKTESKQQRNVPTASSKQNAADDSKLKCPTISSVALTSLELETTMTVFPTSVAPSSGFRGLAAATAWLK